MSGHNSMVSRHDDAGSIVASNGGKGKKELQELREERWITCIAIALQQKGNKFKNPGYP